MKKGTKLSIVCMLLLVFIIPIIIWCGALANNLALTVIHKDKIENMQFTEYEEPLPEFDWYRVTSYSELTIEIHFVNTYGEGAGGGYKVGGKMTFSKTPNGWHHTEMEDGILWSGAGSADDYIWPYWHHIFLA